MFKNEIPANFDFMKWSEIVPQSNEEGLFLPFFEALFERPFLDSKKGVFYKSIPEIDAREVKRTGDTMTALHAFRILH